MSLYLVFAALTIAALAFLLRPLLRHPMPAPRRLDYDLAVYREQLAEVEKDRARGLLGANEAEAARAEIHRRMLTAEDAEKPFAGLPHAVLLRRQFFAILAVVFLVPAGAGLVYGALGSPALPGEPYAARMRDDPDFALSIEAEKAALAVRNHPTAENYSRLGDILFKLGRYDDAAEAYKDAKQAP